MIFGIDHLGGARYKKIARKAHPRNFAAGVFWDVPGFGPAKELIEGWAKDGVSLIRIQLLWDDDHRYPRSVFKEAKKRAAIVESIAIRFPNTTFQVSGACEHELPPADARELATMCKSVSPHCEYVNSPLPKGAVLPEEINEFHGTEEKPRKCPRYQFSFDGTNCVDENVTQYKENYKDAKVFFFWGPQANGNKNMKREDTLSRPKRTAFPTSELIQSWAYLATDRGNTQFRGILKSHSEQTSNNTAADTRGNRLLVITEIDTPKVHLYLKSGRRLASSYERKTFSGGGWRHYFKSYGFKLALQAEALEGSRIVAVRAADKKLGEVNPGFRDGTYR